MTGDFLLNLCCELAEEIPSDISKYRIGAIITDSRGNILSRGTNSYTKTHTLQAKYAKLVGEAGRIFRHAEVHALSRLTAGQQAYAIYIGRINRDGTIGMAKPCRICERAILEAGIKEVHYTVS